MSALHEEPAAVSNSELRQVLVDSGPKIEEELKKCSPESIQVINDFVEGLVTNRTRCLFGTEIYDSHMDQQSQEFAQQRPFGIELDTLTHNARLLLMPRTVFPPGDWERIAAEEEGLTVQEEGPQAIVYFLDDFGADTKNPSILTTNLIFMAHLTAALHTQRFSYVEGERSEEFGKEIEGALHAAREYLAVLQAETLMQLPRRMKDIHDLIAEKVPEYARAYTAYNAEPMKTPGLYESGEAERELPDDAIKKDSEFLHLSQRDLPLNIAEGPQSPWKEYTTNKWNRSYRLYGRYEAGHNGDTTLRVDYELDSTHFPLNYGFFSTLEVMGMADGKMQQHTIFGQEVGAGFRAYPIIVAGDFDFSNFENVTRMMKLANDENTKKEVSDVVRDILSLSEKGTLNRIEQ